MKKALWLMTVVALIAMALSIIPAAVADTDAKAPASTEAPQSGTQPEPKDAEGTEAPEPAGDDETPDGEKTEDEIPVVVPETFTGSVKVELVNKGTLYYGDEIILRAKVENANMPYELRWETLDGSEWKPIPGETGAEYRFIVDEENAELQYRVVVITAE